jgi:peptidylprolyl isomerase/peptidyl-prolyl cis-trans isomerase D
MARLMDRQMRPDSASAEHILIAYREALRANPNLTRSKEEAKALADSIFQVVRRNPSKLAGLAVSLSDDGSAANNSGNLGWFQDGEMVYSFNEAAIKGKKNDIVMVESPFGYHIIHVTGQAKPSMKVRVAQIEVPIEFSTETHDDYYRIAARFAGENTTKEKFDQAVIDQGLEKREATFLREMQLDLPTFTNTRQIIRWIYWDDRKVGDVSPLFDTGKQLFVVVYTGSREDGVVPYDDMKDRLVNNLKNDRKADYIISRIEEMGTYDLSAIAEAFNTSVDTLTGFSFNSRNIPGYGTEHTVIGRLFTYEEGENTGPIKGNAGVFVAEIDHKYEAPELGNYDAYVNQKRTDFEQRVQNNFAYKAIENTASIKDFRKYYY